MLSGERGDVVLVVYSHGVAQFVAIPEVLTRVKIWPQFK